MTPSPPASLRDVVPDSLLPSAVRNLTRNSFPASLSQSWGEAAWTAPDLWMTTPILAGRRASAAMSRFAGPIEVELEQRDAYRRLRRTVRDAREHANAHAQTARSEVEQRAQDMRLQLEQGIRQSRSQVRHERSRIEDATAPTDAMLALGTATSKWVARLIVLAFAVVAIGLGIELGVAESIPFP